MKNSGFTIINNDILRDDNLNIYEKYFLMALKSFDHKDIGEVYPTYETLMKLFGTTKRNTIAKLIKSLKDKNYIIVMKKNRANCYKFIKDYLVVNTKEDKSDNISSLKDTTTSNPKDTVNSNSRDTNISKNDNISSLKDTSTSNPEDTSNSNLGDTDINKNTNISSLKDTSTSNPKDTVNSNQEDTDINKNDNISSLKDTTTSNLKDTGNSNQEDTDISKNDNISSLKDTSTSNPKDTVNSNQEDTNINKNNNISSLKDTSTSNLKDTSNSIPVDTLKIKEKNTKEKYIIILNAWNDTDIYNEDCLNTKIKNSITMALRRHTLEEILTSIKNYQEVYYSDYYYDYTWSLQTFLVKPNGLKKFLSEGEIWTDYKATQKKPKKEEFNISDFID